MDTARDRLLPELHAAARASTARAIADVFGDGALTEDSSALYDELTLAVGDRAVAAGRAHLDGTHRASAALFQP